MNQTVSALLSLRELILSGALAPGERLTEIAVAERLGVSRTPLRAALAQLAAEGLLDALAAGGYAVRGFSAADINDAIELRGVLEGVAARFAAEDGAFQEYVALNEAFHDGLIALAGSQMVARELARVAALPFASPSAFVVAQSLAADAWDILVVAQAQHHAVLEAITAREGARAEALMREHARVARRNLSRVLGGQSPLALIKGGAFLGRTLPEPGRKTNAL